MNPTLLVVEIGPEEKIQAHTGFDLCDTSVLSALPTELTSQFSCFTKWYRHTPCAVPPFQRSLSRELKKSVKELLLARRGVRRCPAGAP